MKPRAYFRTRFFKLGHDPMSSGRVDSAITTVVATVPISGRVPVVVEPRPSAQRVMVEHAALGTCTTSAGEANTHGMLPDMEGVDADRTSRFDWPEAEAAL